MIKLAMVIPSLKKGGAERIFSFIANELNVEVFEVYLIVFDGDELQFPVSEHVTVINLQQKSVIKGVPKLIKELKKLKPDVVFSTITHLNIIIGFIKKFFNKPKFIVRNASVLSMDNQYQPLPTVFGFLVKLFYKNLDKIICQSMDMKNDLINNFNVNQNKIVVINNPITTAYTPIPFTEKKDNKINFITVGRLVKPKGIDRLIAILAQLNVDYKFTIVGSGPEFEPLKEMISNLQLEEKVILSGQINNLTSLYKEADFYLHGSYYEGFPNTFLEAASFGLPIISFDALGGINEIIKDGFNGYIAKDNEAFYKLLLQALEYEWDRNMIQKDIFERFNKEKIISKYESALVGQIYG